VCGTTWGFEKVGLPATIFFTYENGFQHLEQHGTNFMYSCHFTKLEFDKQQSGSKQAWAF